MPDPQDQLQLDLTANLAPLFQALEAGLKGVKDRLNAFKSQGDGKIELGADTQKLTDAINDALKKTSTWKNETKEGMKDVSNAAKDMGDKAADAGQRGANAMASWVKGLAATYISIEGARRAVEFLREGIGEAADEQRQINGLSAQFADLRLNVDSSIGKVEEFTAAMMGAGFADEQTRAAVARMLPVTGNLEQAISAVQIAIGRSIKYNNDFGETLQLITGLIAGQERALMPRTMAEYGLTIDRTKSKAEQFQQALDLLLRSILGVPTGTDDAKAKINEMGFALSEFKKGLGSGFLGDVTSAGQALHAMGLDFKEIGENYAKTATWAVRGFIDVVTTGGFEGFLYKLRSIEERMTAIGTARQMLTDFVTPEPVAPKTNARQAAIVEQVKAAAELVAKLKSDAEVRAANEAQAAWEKSFEETKKRALDLFKVFADGLKQAGQRAEEFGRKMAGDMLQASNPEEFERAQIRIEAAKAASDARMKYSGQELADYLVRIEQWKTQQFKEINDKYRNEEAEKAQRAQDEAAQKAEQSLQEAMQRMRTHVQAQLDPLGEVVRKAFDSMNEASALWSSRIVSVMQPLQNAFYNMLTGMKVNWGNVLRQMIATFIMQFVSQILAKIAAMVVAWIVGEKMKTAASAAGAVEQNVAAKAQAKGNASVAATAMSAAIATYFETYAAIPWVGVAVATGYSMLALEIWGALTAAAALIGTGGALLATGGYIDKPTFGLIGEAGPELVAPEKDFKTVVQELLADTIGTVRNVAAMAGRTAVDFAAGGPGAGSFVIEPHYHGMAIVDTGNRAFLRSTARKMNAALNDLQRDRMGR